jgi:hypothetical protein
MKDIITSFVLFALAMTTFLLTASVQGHTTLTAGILVGFAL